MKDRYKLLETILSVAEFLLTPREVLWFLVTVAKMAFSFVMLWLRCVISVFLMIATVEMTSPESVTFSLSFQSKSVLSLIGGTAFMVFCWVWAFLHPHPDPSLLQRILSSKWVSFALISGGIYFLAAPSLPDRFVPGRKPSETHHTVYTHGTIPCTGKIVEARDSGPSYYRHVVSQTEDEEKQHWHIYSTAPFEDPATTGDLVPSSRKYDPSVSEDNGFSVQYAE